MLLKDRHVKGSLFFNSPFGFALFLFLRCSICTLCKQNFANIAYFKVTSGGNLSNIEKSSKESVITIGLSFL